MAGEAALALTPLRAPSLKDRVLHQLRCLIEDRTFEVGAQLPSERELANRLQVSRGTVREAVQLLAALSVVEIRHGHGTFVRSRPSADAVRNEWVAWTVGHCGRIRELLEVRYGLESFAGELAAVRRDANDLAALRHSLHETAEAAHPVDIPALVQSDLSFHHALYVAAGNPALAELLDAIGSQLVRERATTWALDGRPQRSLEQHGEILAALQASDPARARAAVVAHLRSIEVELAQVAGSGNVEERK